MNTAALRLVLAIAYPLLAHWASHRGGGPVAALALLDLALIVLLQPLAQRRGWAWALLALVALALWQLAPTRYPQMLLLAPPLLFTGTAGVVVRPQPARAAGAGDHPDRGGAGALRAGAVGARRCIATPAA